MNVSFFVHFKNIWTVFNKMYNNKFFEILGEGLSHCTSTHIDHYNVQMHFVMHFEN